MFLLNSFSFNMVNQEQLFQGCSVRVEPIGPEEVHQMDLVSAVGHADTARILSHLLGFLVKFNRASVELKVGDEAYLAQYIGPRLPEGATELPEGAKVRFFLIRIYELGLAEHDCLTCSPQGLSRVYLLGRFYSTLAKENIMSKRYYAIRNQYGNETSVGFSNTWYAISFPSKDARDAWCSENSDDQSISPETRKEIVRRGLFPAQPIEELEGGY